MSSGSIDAVGESLRGTDPQAVGDWQLLRRLGAGGMGVVYLARRDDSVAAVKVIAAELADDQGFRSRFHREVNLCRRVQGTNVAALIDGDSDAETPWLAMQYVPGPTLQQYVPANGPLSESDLELLARGTVDALTQIHAAGVIHRDLKPSNVVLTAEGPVVIDLGVATSAEATSLTMTGVVIGSAGWMAPEQLTGETITELSDVFSWGATVAYAATGRPPYGTGRADAIGYRIVHESPDLQGPASG